MSKKANIPSEFLQVNVKMAGVPLWQFSKPLSSAVARQEPALVRGVLMEMADLYAAEYEQYVKEEKSKIIPLTRSLDI